MAMNWVTPRRSAGGHHHHHHHYQCNNLPRLEERNSHVMHSSDIVNNPSSNSNSSSSNFFLRNAFLEPKWNSDYHLPAEMTNGTGPTEPYHATVGVINSNGASNGTSNGIPLSHQYNNNSSQLLNDYGHASFLNTADLDLIDLQLDYIQPLLENRDEHHRDEYREEYHEDQYQDEYQVLLKSIGLPTLQNLPNLHLYENELELYTGYMSAPSMQSHQVGLQATPAGVHLM